MLIKEALSIKGLDRPSLRRLLAFTLGKTTLWLWQYPDYRLDAQETCTFTSLIKAYQDGTPEAYLIGEDSFCSLRLTINHHTLVPRPETEEMAELLLYLLQKKQMNVLDIGTGSGAIALHLASKQPSWSITASDVAPKTLQVAALNRRNHALNRVRLVHSHFFDLISGRFDVIVSNPPYLGAMDTHLAHLGMEPRRALVTPMAGYRALYTIATTAKTYLKEGGMLLMEHGEDQGKKVRTFYQKGNLNRIITLKDSNDKARFTLGFCGHAPAAIRQRLRQLRMHAPQGATFHTKLLLP